MRGGVHHCGSTAFYCTDQAIPLALLLVNRQFHDAAESLLYGRNRFYVDSQDITAVVCIERLSPKALRTVSVLHVAFDAKTDCDIRPRSYCHSYTPEARSRHGSDYRDFAHKSHSEAFDVAMKRFERLCTALCDNSKLTVTLSSDVKSMESAREILHNLRIVLHLKAVCLSFGPWFD